MYIKLKNKNSTINQVWVNVTCPECRDRYDVEMHGEYRDKICRCGAAAFVLTVKGGSGGINLSATYTNRIWETGNLKVHSVEVDGVVYPVR